MNPQKNFTSHLNTLQPHDWDKLFALLPEIQQTAKFGTLEGGEPNENGVAHMPFWKSAQVVGDFVRVFYDLDLGVDFDWTSWTEGERMLNDESYDYTTLDTITLCKLLTAIIRADRFDDGYLIVNFENGVVPKIIRAIQHNVESSE
jgi:hypothetical protein